MGRNGLLESTMFVCHDAPPTIYCLALRAPFQPEGRLLIALEHDLKSMLAEAM